MPTGNTTSPDTYLIYEGYQFGPFFKLIDAGGLGIIGGRSGELLFRWQRKLEDQLSGKSLSENERAELKELRKEVRELRREKATLKRVRALLAEERKWQSPR